MSHTGKSLNFYYNTKNLMFAIARTSPWGSKVGEEAYNENNPPTPSVETTDLTEIIGYKRISEKFFVVPDSSGTYIVDGVRWKKLVPSIIDPDPLKAKKDLISLIKEYKSRWIYLSTVLESTDFVGYSYRQVGVYSELEIDYTNGGTDGQLLYQPNQIITGSGILEVINNRKSITRESDQREMISLVIEF
jgi:hypothetical protein